jgi:hypothetical protein
MTEWIMIGGYFAMMPLAAFLISKMVKADISDDLGFLGFCMFLWPLALFLFLCFWASKKGGE